MSARNVGVTAPTEVEICRDSRQWDAYVAGNSSASNYHRWLWGEVIEATYRHRRYYLTARVEGAVVGVLPLVFVNSHLFGKFLTSLPFFSYGGVLAETDSARNELLVRAADLARELGAKHIEIRQGGELSTEWADRTPKVTMEVLLPNTPDALWAKLTSGLRNKIRNAHKNELRVEWAGREAVPVLYKVFSRNMRDLGTPTYPQSWFDNMCAYCPDGTRIVSVWDKQEPVAAGIITAYRDTVELPWSGSILESRKKYSALLLYWSVMEWAQQNGFRQVDLGRCTKGGGTYEFKRHFGCEERLLHWYFWVAPGASVPELRPDNPKFRLATRIWQKLPLAVANLVGPKIVRGIP